MKRAIRFVICLLAAAALTACGTKISPGDVSVSDGGVLIGGASGTVRPESSSSSEIMAGSEVSGETETEIPLLLSTTGEKGRPRYEVCRWNIGNGNLERQNTVVECLEDSGMQIFWNGRDYLAANPPALCTDEAVEVKNVAFGSACYQGSILRYTDGFENDIWGDRTKLTLTTGGVDTEFDISGMAVPEDRYRPEELVMSGFLLEEETLYVLFCPDMMLEKNLSLYLAEIGMKSRSITRVIEVDAPENCSPADPPVANNVFAKEEGFFVFGSDSVVKISPHDGTVSTLFSPDLLEEETAPHFYIKNVGFHDGYLLVKGEDADWNYYLFAVKNGEVAGTLETGRRFFHMPNLV